MFFNNYTSQCLKVKVMDQKKSNSSQCSSRHDSCFILQIIKLIKNGPVLVPNRLDDEKMGGIAQRSDCSG